MKNNVIISVESRKGGVGKTTAALCISKSLLEKGYAVLLIDTDITGTNIADCMDSPFWNNSLNILTIIKNNEEQRANILSLFEDDFMNGNKIPLPQYTNSKKSFYLDLKKINTIGSQIYSLNGIPETICKPAVLFDQLHGYWFVDFLKELVEDFAGATENKPVAVVLDNSPGYVGISPSIQDWLTDIGPESGKFIFVTSLDSQDMQSCAIAISTLHEKFREKWKTSRMFLRAKNDNGDNLDYSLMKGDFFVRLAEYEDSIGKGISKFPLPLAFYTDFDKSGNAYSENPEKNVGVILNRVPKTVFKHRRIYKPAIDRNNSLLLNLLGGQDSREWSKSMVGYDPYIEYQFMQSGMSKRRYKGKLRRNIDKLLMQKNDIFYNKEFLHITNVMSPKLFSKMNDYISQFQNIIDAELDVIRAHGLDYLTDLIDEDWQPKNIVANLRATFYNFMANAEYPIFKEMYWEEFEDQNIIDSKGFYRFDKIMNLLDVPFEKLEEYPEIRITILYLIASLPLPFGNEMTFDKFFLDFFQAMIKLEIKIINESNNNKYPNLPRILSSKIKHKISIKQLLHEFMFSKRIMQHAEDEFLDFFHAFTSAQARLMRLPEDSRFLVWLIQTMVEHESVKPNTLPYVRKIAEDVIIHKTLSYNAVREKTSSALSEAQFFVDFDKAIMNIINRWGLE